MIDKCPCGRVFGFINAPVKIDGIHYGLICCAEKMLPRARLSTDGED